MLKVQFSKMHGLGNDFVFVNCLAHKLKHPPEVAQAVSDRHFGVGADGLVLICPSDRADFEMRLYHADGSEGRMCGNAIRCVGKYVFDHQLTDKTTLRIDTKRGIKQLTLIVEDEKAVAADVYIGEASFRSKDIPVDTDYPEFISQPMLVHGEVYLVTCVSLDSPHAVIFCEDVEQMNLAEIGSLFESHDKFPEQINVEFVELIDRNHFKMRVWEHGRGETFACGTCACAAVAAAVLNEHCDADSEVTVRLPGGELQITCRADYTLSLKGTATHVFDGEIELAL